MRSWRTSSWDNCLITHCARSTLHLAIAQSAGVKVLATADRAMARTAEALGIRTVTFG